MKKMKNKKIFRSFFVLLAALICMGGFSVTAYAGGGPENEEPAETVAAAEPEETTGGFDPEALTPEGNMSLVDDIAGETSGDKQFITVVTKSGNYFYIIIDRAEDGENTVHFLNQVDEADLMALMEDETASAVTAPAACICTDKCAAGAVNTNCPVCKTDMTNCTGTETASSEPEAEAEESGGGMGGILAVVLILALGGGAAFYYFKVMKPKQSAKGIAGLDDFDFEDDEDEEPEAFEDEQEDIE